MTTNTMNDPAMAWVVGRMQREILTDIRSGRVPATVADYSELHDYVDANEYGGACETDPDVVFDGFTDEQVTFWNAAQGIVDKWLRAGGHRAKLAECGR
jgi:hypothetical protein